MSYNIKSIDDLKEELEIINKQMNEIKEETKEKIEEIKNFYIEKIEDESDECQKRLIYEEYQKELNKIKNDVIEGDYTKLEKKKEQLEHLINYDRLNTESTPSTGVYMWGNSSIENLKEKYRCEEGLLPLKYYEGNERLLNKIDIELSNTITSLTSSNCEYTLIITEEEKNKIISFYNQLTSMKEELESQL
jgi:hypothetical protein